ncbi:glycosyl transferase [Escherichia coli]
MIPKIIHYCWFGRSPLSELTKQCIASWEKYCPEYKIIRWDENNVDLNSCSFVRQAYKEKKWAFVSDYVRLKVVNEYGGIYLDTDVELIKPLDDLLIYPAYIGFEINKEWYVNSGLGFGSVNNNPVLESLIMEYENINFVNEDGTLNITPCPIRETKALTKIGLIPDGQCQSFDNIVIFSADYFCPVSITGERNFSDKTYSIHHYDVSWFSEQKRKGLQRKKRFIKLFGNLIGTYINKPFIFVDECREFGLVKAIKNMRSNFP